MAFHSSRLDAQKPSAFSLGSSAEEYGICIATGEINDLFIGGARTDTLGRTAALLSRLDSNMYDLWNLEVDYGNGFLEEMKAIVYSETHLYCAINTSKSNGDADRAYLLKVDTGGTVIWARSLFLREGGRIHDLALLSSGDLMLCGSLGITQNDRKGLVSRLDTAGSERWTRLYGGSKVIEITSIRENNQKIYLTGYHGNADLDALYGCLDGMGRAIWVRALSSPDFDNFYSLELDSNELKLFGGSWKNSQKGILLASADTSGNLLRSRRISFPASSIRTFNSFRKKTGDFFLPVYQFGATNNEAALIKLDRNFRITEEVHVSGPLSDNFRDLTPYRNGVLALGTTKSFGRGGAEMLISDPILGLNRGDSCLSRVTYMNDTVSYRLDTLTISDTLISELSTAVIRFRYTDLQASPLCTFITPIASFSAVDTICTGECLYPENLSKRANKYSWRSSGFAPASSFMESPDSICSLNAGDYEIKLYAENAFALDSFTRQVHVKAATEYRLDTNLCDSDSILIGNTTFRLPGLFSDTLTNQVGCDSIVDIQINDLTAFSLDTTLCLGDTLYYDGLALKLPAFHTDTIVRSSKCRIARSITATKEIYADKLPEDTSVCELSFLLLDPGPFNSYLWEDGSQERVRSVDTSGTYSVILNSRYCEFRDSIKVVFDKQSCSCHVWFPTAFSPNEDGDNDGFGAEAECNFDYFELRIFARNGEQIWYSNDALRFWDGKHRDRYVPPGRYVFFCRYRSEQISDKINSLKGTFMLIR